MTSYTNVSINTAANVYFDGRCVSHSFTLSDGTRKSAGVIFPARLTFGTGNPETMDIQAGRCRIRLAGTEEWREYTAGDSFSVPGESSFDIEVTELLDYVCHYG
ncbi:pyrimidine/purine nucleoside phosphorylase [Nocardioides sp. BP30]|uniref:pyrimidine/purine nucleoside phosphorylase n=1 Tax=Nocardioides sp. BP30 TaxID=3036374 RepID=UPI0024688609|nr:pyrimidine/purine nucleoside phosphorylase [Nocardioides sp. BP30]WGL52050.1 pyrimidine/purine nucleoside phosphorylase [Nocardioides sp. BP30]